MKGGTSPWHQNPPAVCSLPVRGPPGPPAHAPCTSLLGFSPSSLFLFSTLKCFKKKWVKSLSHVRLFANPWIVDSQAPPTIEFSRQECWSRLPVPSPGDLPDPWIEPRSPALQADALPSEPPGKPLSLFLIAGVCLVRISYTWVLMEFPFLPIFLSACGSSCHHHCPPSPHALATLHPAAFDLILYLMAQHPCSSSPLVTLLGWTSAACAHGAGETGSGPRAAGAEVLATIRCFMPPPQGQGRPLGRLPGPVQNLACLPTISC